MTTFGLLVFDEAEELDLVGPWEVFTASSMLKEAEGGNADTVVLIAETLDPVRCNKGMRVLPDHTTADHPPLDVVLVPGGQGTREEKDNASLMTWLADVAGRAAWVTSVCTGALLLHEAGFAVSVREFVPRSVTPRNLLVLARRERSARAQRSLSSPTGRGSD